MKRIPDIDNLTALLEWACSITEPTEPVAIPLPEAKAILAILQGLPGSKPRGVPKEWTRFDDMFAMNALVRDRPVEDIAREICALTGQNRKVPLDVCRR